MSKWRRNRTGLFNGWWTDLDGRRIRRIRRHEYPELYRLYRILKALETEARTNGL